MTSVAGGVTDYGNLTGKPIEVVTTATPAGVAAAELTGISTAFNAYEVKIASLVPASDGADLHLQVTEDGGATWESGASAYSWTTNRMEVASSSSTNGSTGDSKVRLTDGAVGGAGGEHVAGVVNVHSPTDGSLVTHVDWRVVALDQNGDLNTQWGAGTYLTASAVDGVRLLFSAGNVSSGHVDLIGVGA